MSKQTIAMLGGGLASGLLYALAANGVVGSALLVPLPLFLAGLGAGFAPALIACGVGVIVAAGLVAPEAGLNYAVASAAPVLLMTRRALLNRTGATGDIEWYPPGLLLAWLAGLGILILMGMAMLYLGTPGGLEAEVHHAVVEALTQMSARPEPQRIDAFADTIAPVLPGLGIAGWEMVVALDGILAQGLLARFGRNLRPSPRIEDVELPHWMPVVLAGAALTGFLGRATGVGTIGFLGWNAVAILLVPFFFAGLGVVHALVRRLSGGIFALVLFYAVMAIFGWPVLLVAGLGLIDQWVMFRTRWRNDPSKVEDK